MLVCFASALLRGETAAPAWPFDESDIAADPAVRFGELENGLRYAIMPNAEPRDRVSLRLYVGAGSLHERDDQRGLAHYVEHLAFNGTENFGPGELVEYFQNLGMSFGADTNAYTGFDRTVYQIELPGSEADAVDEALFVLRDFAGRMLMDEDEVNSERGVILSEKRDRDSVGFRTAVEEFSFLLSESIVPERFPIGTEEVLENATRDDLLEFYDAWYRPERVAVIIVGEIDPGTAESLIEGRFGDFEARRAAPDEPERGRVVVRDGEARLHTEAEAPSTRVAIQSVQPYEPQPDTVESRIEKLRRSVAMRMLNRRLDVLAREEDAAFSRGAVGAYDLFDFFTNASIELHTRPEQWEDALGTAERELRRALEFGFQEAEIAEIRANVINSYEEAVRGAPTRRSSALAEGLVRSISGNTVFSDPETELEIMKPALEAMTPEECLAALREAFPDGNRFIFVTGNVDFPDPEETILAVYEASLEEAVLPPETLEEVVFAYESFGTPGGVAAREHFEDLDIYRLRFDNGVRLNLKRTDFSSNSVQLTARLGGGRLTEPEDLAGVALLASQTFVRGGLGEHSADELRRIFAGRNVGWSFSAGEDAFVFTGQTTPGDLEAQLGLLAAYLTDPGYRSEALRRARSDFDEQYTLARRTSRGVLQDEVSRYLAGGDHRFGLPPQERLMELDLDDVSAWLEAPLTRHYLELSVVGDFDDPESVIEKVAATVGALPEREGEKPDFAREREVSRVTGATEERFEFESRIPSGLTAVFWPIPDMWEIERTRRFNVLGRVFSDRMRVKIREEMGEAYSPQAFANPSLAYTDYGWFTALVGIDPAKAETVADAVIEIARDVRRDGISESELQRALRPMLTSIRDQVRQNRYWMNSVLADSQSSRHVGRVSAKGCG